MSFKQNKVPFQSWGPGPRFDGVTISAYSTGASLNFTHRTTGNRNCHITVCVSIFGSGTVSSISYGAMSLALERADTVGSLRQEIWKGFMGSTSGGAATVACTFSGSLTCIATALSVCNHDQTAYDTAAAATGTGGTATGSITPTVDDCRVVAFLMTSDLTVTLDSGQTPYATNSGASGTAFTAGEFGVVYPKGSTTVSWGGMGGSDTWIISLLSLKPFQPSVYAPPTVFLKDMIGYGGMIPWAR